MVSTATRTATHLLPTPHTLFILTLASLSGVATAWRHPSYQEKMVASTHAMARARENHPLFEDFYNSPGVYAKGGNEAASDIDSLVQRLLEVDPEQLRQTVLASVVSLLEEAGGSSSSRSLQEEQASEDRAVKETPEDYHRCLNHTAETIIAITQKQRWALLMLDAMGKPGRAISEGNLLWLGAYDMCRKIRTNTSLPSAPDFSGQYCNAYVQIKSQSLMSTGALVALGMCVPDTCSNFDLSFLLTDVVRRLGIPYNVEVDCHTWSKPLDAKAVVAIVICSILLVLLVLGTAADVLQQQQQRLKEEMGPQTPYVSANGQGPHDEHLPLLPTARNSPPAEPGILLKMLMAFSVYTNGSKLLSMKQQPGSLNCVHGIRFLSMTWVVLGHGFMYPISVSENAGPYMQEFINRWSSQAISNALVSVDSFFVLSGLLVSYLTLKELQKRNGRLNWFMFYFHRFWRLTPAYMLVIMVYLCLSPYWGDGPVWPTVNPDRDNCEDNWWTNLLYINNFVRTKDMCLGQSWYLANDMQFYCVLSPLVILPLFYYPVAGYVVSLVLILAHCVTNAALTMHNDYPPGMFAQVKSSTPPDMASWGPDFYMKPYTRWGPYVIGMLAGYFLHTSRCKLSIPWYVSTLLWGMATAAALAVLYGLYGASTGHPITVSLSAFYNAMHRNVWAVCLCWVIIACVTGHGGFVNTLLSWPGFMPLSRLTYCIYLLHLMIMSLYLFNSRSLFYFSDVNVVMFFLSVLVISYMASAVASLAFEAPMMALEKVIFSHDRPRDSSPPKQEYREEQNGFYTNKH